MNVFNQLADAIRPKQPIKITLEFEKEQDSILIPLGQTALIQKALNYYIEQSSRFNKVPTDTEAYELLDMSQLSAMMNYPISISISEDDKDRFATQHGVDFPTYIY